MTLEADDDKSHFGLIRCLRARAVLFGPSLVPFSLVSFPQGIESAPLVLKHINNW